MSTKLAMSIIGALILLLAVQTIANYNNVIVMRSSLPCEQVLKFESMAQTRTLVNTSPGQAKVIMGTTPLISWKTGTVINVLRVEPGTWPEITEDKVGRTFVVKNKPNTSPTIEWR